MLLEMEVKGSKQGLIPNVPVKGWIIDPGITVNVVVNELITEPGIRVNDPSFNRTIGKFQLPTIGMWSFLTTPALHLNIFSVDAPTLCPHPLHPYKGH